MNDFVKIFLGAVVGAVFAAGTGYLASRWTEEGQRRQFLIEKSQAFSEFLSLNYLPHTDQIPDGCQKQLEECRRLRQTAIETYLFVPSYIQDQLVKSFGPNAVEAVSPSNAKNLTAEAIALYNALRLTREWLTEQKDVNFNFILPCSDWKAEEKICAKQK